ncbi:uncharacterized protein P884DRAFT_265328 [Thermothelomyces heterothallicus CBS 202.75]|uniref:uncharacterized protein n=1 Tax=Thermothelomyces heterothallicus CBS 202.75 TaxID=1149848 RepID=UPI003741FBAC
MSVSAHRISARTSILMSRYSHTARRISPWGTLAAYFYYTFFSSIILLDTFTDSDNHRPVFAACSSMCTP